MRLRSKRALKQIRTGKQKVKWEKKNNADWEIAAAQSIEKQQNRFTSYATLDI